MIEIPPLKLSAWSRASFTAALAVIAACSGDPSPTAAGPAPVHRDSLGIEIVESTLPRLAHDVRAEDISLEISIGGADHASQYDLFNVTGAARFADGTIIVLNSGGSELLFLDAAGALVRKLGRKGEGPGEFLRPEHLEVLPGDTLRVWDTALGPVSTLDPAGRFLRQQRIDLAGVMAALGFAKAVEQFTPCQMARSSSTQ